MSSQASPSRKMALIMSACAALVASGSLVAREGWELKGYADPVHGARVPTACAGVTKGVVLGRTYTEAECISMTLDALVENAGPISACLPDAEPLPSVDLVKEQVDLAYNLGTTTYLKSSMCRRLKAGDYRGTCEAITLYKYAGGLDCSIRSNNCYGVWLRRLEARSKCLSAAGLR